MWKTPIYKYKLYNMRQIKTREVKKQVTSMSL